MDVAFSFDDQFALPGSVAILSLFRANPRARIHVFTDPSPRSAPLLQAIAAACGGDLRIVDAAPEKLCGFETVSDYGVETTATYRRIFLPELLPDLDRLIYVDADTIVRRDLTPLWETDLGDSPLGGVEDAWMVTMPAMRERFPQGYFNAGVLLFDLARARAEQLTSRAVAEVQRQHGLTRLSGGNALDHRFEQTPLNEVLRGRWRRLSPSYNFTTMTTRRIAARLGISGDEFDGILADPAIVHFFAGHKPWLPAFRQLTSWHGEFHELRQALEKSFDLTGLTWPGAFTNGAEVMRARRMMALSLVHEARVKGLEHPAVVLTGLLAQEIIRVAGEQRFPLSCIVTDYPALIGNKLEGYEIIGFDEALGRGERDFILGDYRRPDLFRSILIEEAALRDVEIRILDVGSPPGVA